MTFLNQKEKVCFINEVPSLFLKDNKPKNQTLKVAPTERP